MKSCFAITLLVQFIIFQSCNSNKKQESENTFDIEKKATAEIFDSSLSIKNIVKSTKKTIDGSLQSKAEDELKQCFINSEYVFYGKVISTKKPMKSVKNDQGWITSEIRILQNLKGNFHDSLVNILNLGNVRSLMRDPSIFSNNEKVEDGDFVVCFTQNNGSLMDLTKQSVHSCIKKVVLEKEISFKM